VSSVYSRFHSLFLIVILLVSGGVLLHAQDSKQRKQKDSKDSVSQTQQDQDQEQDPLKRPLSKEQQTKATREKEGPYYKRWVDNDVRWIITDEELYAFKKLATNAERD